MFGVGGGDLYRCVGVTLAAKARDSLRPRRRREFSLLTHGEENQSSSHGEEEPIVPTWLEEEPKIASTRLEGELSTWLEEEQRRGRTTDLKTVHRKFYRGSAASNCVDLSVSRTQTLSSTPSAVGVSPLPELFWKMELS